MERLPDEILVEIFKGLPIRDYLHMLDVNKKYRNLLYDKQILKTIIFDKNNIELVNPVLLNKIIESENESLFINAGTNPIIPHKYMNLFLNDNFELTTLCAAAGNYNAKLRYINSIFDHEYDEQLFEKYSTEVKQNNYVIIDNPNQNLIDKYKTEYDYLNFLNNKVAYSAVYYYSKFLKKIIKISSKTSLLILYLMVIKLNEPTVDDESMYAQLANFFSQETIVRMSFEINSIKFC
jgi:hypothetical protein